MNARKFKILGLVVLCLVLAFYAPMVASIVSLYSLDQIFHPGRRTS